MFPFLAKVTHWDCGKETERIQRIGFFAENYSAAANIVEGVFGDDLIDMHLYALEEGDVFFLTADAYDSIKEDRGYGD